MTDRWFSFIVWLAVIAMPIATLSIADVWIRRHNARSRKTQHLSNEWLYQHRGRANV